MNGEAIQSERHLRLPSDQIIPNRTIKPTGVVYQRAGNETTYYLPCYVRFLLKQIEKIKIQDMEAELMGTLIFTFNHQGIPRALIEKFTGKDEKQPAIMLEFNKEDSILLREGKGISMKQKENLTQFIVRQKFNVHLSGHVFLTPFEKLHMNLTITAQSVHIKGEGNSKHIFKFNCLYPIKDDQNPIYPIRHGRNISFGQYRIISNQMIAEYTNERDHSFDSNTCCLCCEQEQLYQESSEEQEAERQEQLANRRRSARRNEPAGSYNVLPMGDPQEIQPFQYAHFRIPVYRFPGPAILSIFIPIYILAAIGLLVFFQETNLKDRLAAIAVLILAFVAFIPTVNDSIPQSPTIKLVQILIFIHLLALALLGAQSYISKDKDISSFVWYEDNFYRAALALNGISLVVMVFLFIYHKCCRERAYKQPVKRMLKKPKKIDPTQWENKKCELYFQTCERRYQLRIMGNGQVRQERP